MKKNLQLAAFLMVGVLLGNLLGGFVHAQTYLIATEVPRGTILLMAAACPTGYVEVTALNGAMPLGTLAANGDVGTTGGSNTITPTVASLTAAAQTVSWPVGVPTFAGSTLAATTFAIATGSGSFKGTSSGGFSTVGGAAPGSAGATTSKSPGTPAGTVAWPAGVPTNSTSSVTGTLNSFDSRSAFVRVIFCQKS
jgi:hypothetical protein